MAVLMNVMGLFRENHLRALPYKGPTLSAQIFGNAAVRDAADLDILLPVDHARKAYDLLTKHGFQPIRPYTPAVMDQLFRYRAEIGLVRDEILLELQWRLAPKYFSVEMDVEAVVARAGSIPFGNAQVPVMAPEDNLLALCIHGAKHQWQTLKWIVDVDLFVRRHPELSWATVTTRATTSGTLRMLLTTLFLSQELMATPLPPGVAQQMLSDPEATALAKSCIAMLQSGEEPTEAQHHRFMLRLRERTKDRMLYVARLAYQPTESEWDAIALPRGLVWLYYGVRAGRVFFKSLRLLLP